MKHILSTIAAVLLLTACGKAPTPDEVIQTNFKGLNASYHCMDWKGVERCYYLIEPESAPKGLIVALHPAFTPVRMTEEVSHMAALAAPRGYVVAYPEGIDKQWNDFRVMTDVKTYQDKTDDVGFIDTVTAKLQKQFKFTPAHTTVAGMSNGGMMSLRLSCQSERYGTVAAVVANLPVGLRDACKAKPKKTMLMFGTEDDVVEYNGGVLADSGIATTWGEVESARKTEAFFAKRSGCSAPTITIAADTKIDSTRAIRRDYTACERAPVTAIRVVGMGHTWPGEESRLLAWITTRGAVSHQFNAGETVLDFIEH